MSFTVGNIPKQERQHKAGTFSSPSDQIQDAWSTRYSTDFAFKIRPGTQGLPNQHPPKRSGYIQTVSTVTSSAVAKERGLNDEGMSSLTHTRAVFTAPEEAFPQVDPHRAIHKPIHELDKRPLHLIDPLQPRYVKKTHVSGAVRNTSFANTGQMGLGGTTTYHDAVDQPAKTRTLTRSLDLGSTEMNPSSLYGKKASTGFVMNGRSSDGTFAGFHNPHERFKTTYNESMAHAPGVAPRGVFVPEAKKVKNKKHRENGFTRDIKVAAQLGGPNVLGLHSTHFDANRDPKQVHFELRKLAKRDPIRYHHLEVGENPYISTYKLEMAPPTEQRPKTVPPTFGTRALPGAEPNGSLKQGGLRNMYRTSNDHFTEEQALLADSLHSQPRTIIPGSMSANGYTRNFHTLADDKLKADPEGKTQATTRDLSNTSKGFGDTGTGVQDGDGWRTTSQIHCDPRLFADVTVGLHDKSRVRPGNMGTSFTREIKASPLDWGTHPQTRKPRSVYPGGPYVGGHDDALNQNSYMESRESRVVREDAKTLMQTRGIVGSRTLGLENVVTSADLARGNKFTVRDDGKEQFYLDKTVEKMLALENPACLKNWGGIENTRSLDP